MIGRFTLLERFGLVASDPRELGGSGHETIYVQYWRLTHPFLAGKLRMREGWSSTLGDGSIWISNFEQLFLKLPCLRQ